MKLLQTQQKRVRELERNLLNKSKLMVSQVKQEIKKVEEKPQRNIDVDKLKARCNTLEKANEHAKSKLSCLEVELTSRD